MTVTAFCQPERTCAVYINQEFSTTEKNLDVTEHVQNSLGKDLPDVSSVVLVTVKKWLF